MLRYCALLRGSFTDNGVCIMKYQFVPISQRKRPATMLPTGPISDSVVDMGREYIQEPSSGKLLRTR